MSGKGSYRDELEGSFTAEGHSFALIAARFNSTITDVLLSQAHDCLIEHGASGEEIAVIRVPGAWELPQAARLASESGRFDAIIALGCVVRGETPHFEYICEEVSRGLGVVARTGEAPLVFGVLTTNTAEQALMRAEPGGGNKGREVALAALEMVEVFRRLREAGS